RIQLVPDYQVIPHSLPETATPESLVSGGECLIFTHGENIHARNKASLSLYENRVLVKSTQVKVPGSPTSLAERTMSLSLAKKSLKSFDGVEESNKTIKKSKKPKLNQQNNENDKIQKLLLLTSSCLDDKMTKKLLRNATKTKRGRLMKSVDKQDEDDSKKKEQQSAFTEEDFENFAKELEKIQN
ncbi:CLUMA_CG013253, isoform A, partial [Clunio marinus]